VFLGEIFDRNRGWMASWALGAALVLGLAQPSALDAAGLKSRLLDKYIIDSWQTEDGLPQNSITSITQTPDSYLWLGTFNGLVRFDGVRFKTFDPAGTPAMRSGRITKLLSTPSDLWCVSESGDVVRMTGGRFTGFSSENGLPAAGAEFLSSDASGHIWMRDRGGNVHQYDGGRFRPAELPAGVAPGNFDWFLHDRSGPWIFQHDRSIARLTGSRYVTLTEPATNQPAYVRNALPARDGTMWLTNGRVLRKYDERGWRESVWNYSPQERTSVFDMCEDREGNVWLATFGRGLFCCQTNGGVKHITVADGLSHDTLRSIFQAPMAVDSTGSNPDCLASTM
jgi:ligand-binding sensor domain-containing protein